jgi:hypothetical protein
VPLAAREISLIDAHQKQDFAAAACCGQFLETLALTGTAALLLRAVTAASYQLVAKGLQKIAPSQHS